MESNTPNIDRLRSSLKNGLQLKVQDKVYKVVYNDQPTGGHNCAPCSFWHGKCTHPHNVLVMDCIMKGFVYLEYKEQKTYKCDSTQLIKAISQLKNMFPTHEVTMIEFEDGSGLSFNYKLNCNTQPQYIKFISL